MGNYNHAVSNYYGVPTNADWMPEYLVIEYWSGAQEDTHFKTVVASTPFYDVAVKLMNEDPLHRKWVLTYRIVALHEAKAA